MIRATVYAIGVQPKVLTYMEQNYKYVSILSIQWWFNFCWSFLIPTNDIHCLPQCAKRHRPKFYPSSKRIGNVYKNHGTTTMNFHVASKHTTILNKYDTRHIIAILYQKKSNLLKSNSLKTWCYTLIKPITYWIQLKTFGWSDLCFTNEAKFYFLANDNSLNLR